MKLRTRFIIIFCSVIFVPFFFMGLILYKNSSKIILKHTLDHLKTLALVTESRVDEVYARYYDHVHIAATRPSLYQALDGFFKEDTPQTRQAVKDNLTAFEPVHDGIENIFIFDMQGNLISGTNKDWDGKNAAQERFFQEGKKHVFFDLIKTTPRVAYKGQLIFAAPVAPHLNILAVMLVMVNSEPFSEISRTYLKIGASEDIILGRRNAKGDAEFITPRRFDGEKGSLEIIPQGRNENPMLRAVNGEETIMEHGIDYRGQHILAATHYVDALGIGIVVKIDESEYLKPIEELNKITFVFGGIVILFTIFIAWVVARTLSEPIVRLSRLAGRIAAGELSVQLGTDFPLEDDEIGDLTRSFSSMTKTLIDSHMDLEAQVQARTVELQKKLDELSRFNRINVGRELRMIELKKEIKELRAKLDENTDR